MATQEYMTSQTYSATIGGTVYNVTTGLAGYVASPIGWYSVTDYGAAGDGVTNDTAAIQAAIDAAEAAGGGVVSITGGNFLFSQLVIGDYITLAGAGRLATTLTHTGAAQAIKGDVASAAKGACTFRDITLAMNANTTIGLDLSRMHDCVISSVHITGSKAAGIGILFDDGASYSAYYNSCYDVIVNGNGTLGYGFKFGTSANENSLVNCRTISVLYPVEIAGTTANAVKIIDCSFESFTTAVHLGGYGRHVLAFCRFENASTGLGVLIESTSGYNTIQGNFFTGVTTSITNNATTTQMSGGDVGQVMTKYLSMNAGGGMASTLSTRGYSLQLTGDVGAAGVFVVAGDNTPEGAVSAIVGSLYLRTNGGANTTLYIKESGTGTTGWVAK